MTAKERHKINLLKYLGNPELEFPKRKDYPGILRITKNTLYKHLTPLELQAIEKEAVDIRREASSRQRAIVLSSLFKRANGYTHPDVHISSYEGLITKTDIIKHYPPDKGAAQEFLDRTEGKVPLNVDAKVSGDLIIELVDFCNKDDKD